MSEVLLFYDWTLWVYQKDCDETFVNQSQISFSCGDQALLGLFLLFSSGCCFCWGCHHSQNYPWREDSQWNYDSQSCQFFLDHSIQKFHSDSFISMLSTCVSGTTPHLAIALKKSDLESQPLLYRSKNLKALKRTASLLTFDDALNWILFFNSFSNLI